MSPTRHADAVQHSSLDPNWRTPPDLFAALHEEFGFQIDLAADADAALIAPWLGPGSPIGENALIRSWAGLEIPQPIGFLNPPYSRERVAAYRKAGDVTAAQTYEIHNWAAKAWIEARAGFTTVGVFPYTPQTRWWRAFVLGQEGAWGGQPRAFAAAEVRIFPHRINFLRADGTPASSAGGNTAVIVWRPMVGAVWPWVPHQYYWTFRDARATADEETIDVD